MEIKNGFKGGNEKTSRKGRSTLEISPNNVKLHPVLHNLEELYTFIKHRRLLTESSDQENGAQAYTTYRSCIPAVDEEKLSVLGFEVCLRNFCLFGAGLALCTSSYVKPHYIGSALYSISRLFMWQLLGLEQAMHVTHRTYTYGIKKNSLMIS